ncbi:MAG: hypothetical protein ACREMY_03185 [bacterium]
MTKNQNPPIYTGDIAAERLDGTREYSAENQEIVFSEEQHSIWRDLYTGIHQPYLLEHICREYVHGLELLQLDPQRIPTIEYLNGQIQRQTGWRIERTVVRYTVADNWYVKFAQRISWSPIICAAATRWCSHPNRICSTIFSATCPT